MKALINLTVLAIVLIVPANAMAQFDELREWPASPYPYHYGYSPLDVYDPIDLYGGFDGEVGGDDWYYDYYDLNYGYDDWYVDRLLDNNDVAALEARDDLDDRDDLEDITDTGAESVLMRERLDEEIPGYRDEEIDWDLYEANELYDGGIYDGYGYY